ncbi:hypothetical protein STEG23_030913 [Scotinomys teguina]
MWWDYLHLSLTVFELFICYGERMDVSPPGLFQSFWVSTRGVIFVLGGAGNSSVLQEKVLCQWSSLEGEILGLDPEIGKNWALEVTWPCKARLSQLESSTKSQVQTKKTFERDSFNYPGFFVFPYEVENCSFQVCEDLSWDFDRNCIESVDCFWQVLVAASELHILDKFCRQVLVAASELHILDKFCSVCTFPVCLSSVPFQCAFPVYLSSVPFQCAFPVCLSSVTLQCAFPVCLSSVPFQCAFPVYLSSVPFQCASPVCLSSVPFQCASPVYLSSVSFQCASPVYLSSVPFQCASPVCLSSVPLQCTFPVCLSSVPFQCAFPVCLCSVPFQCAFPVCLSSVPFQCTF